MAYPAPVESLVRAFEALPGVGRVSAERLTFHVLRDAASGRDLREALARALSDARRCRTCGNVSEDDVCGICSDDARDAATIAVVEEPRHVEALEKAGVFRGRYHVLMGAFAPLEGVDPSDLTVGALRAKAKADGVDTTPKSYGGEKPLAEGEAQRRIVSGDLMKMFAHHAQEGMEEAS